MSEKRSAEEEVKEPMTNVSKRGRFGDKKIKSVNTKTLENARRVLELASKIEQNPIIQALKASKAKTQKEEREESSRAPLPSQEEELAAARGQKYFDPNILPRVDRSRRRQFLFIQEGQYEQEAELERLRMKYGDDVADRVDRGQVRGLRGVKWEDIQRYLDAGQKKFDPGTIKEELEGIRREDEEMDEYDEGRKDLDLEEEIPNVEWWDQNILEEEFCEEYTAQPFPIRSARINFYVEHPVPVDPPGEDNPTPPQPLRLTKKEMRKLRTQRRQQREREKQELIKQGLLEPPKPKVKLSNMMRVLAEEAVTDPTSIEREVRKQMIERQQAHEDRNLARKLTPAERKQKNLKKLFSKDNGDVHVCVFKVAELKNTKIQFKVTINAEENRLTGCCLVAQPFSLVVVEGCYKATSRYKKLMLRRIQWNEKLDEEMEVEEKESYGCYLVWEGYVKERAFEDFKMDECRSEGMARRYLGSFMVGHYWDLAKSYIPDDISTANP